MSTLIGYWSDITDDRSSQELQRLLCKAVARLSSSELRTTFSQSFGIAVHGRGATIYDNHSAQVTVAGEGFAPDVWARCSNGKLILGRDIFGRVPIFWTISENALWFSNRLDTLLAVVKHPNVSFAGVYAFGCYSYVPAPQTPLENVFAVAAGKELTWHGVHLTPEQTDLHQWREAGEQIEEETKAARRLRQLLEESVEAQLANYSGEPLGVFLSGGLDSSVTAALLVRAGAKVRGYTLDFQADCFSETAYAEEVAGSLGIPLTKVPVTANCMKRALPATANRLDGLFGDSVTVPLAIMYERAGKEVETIFNGEGGDQLFAGWTNKPLIAGSIYEGPDAFTDLYMRTFHRFHGCEKRVYTQSIMREIDTADFRAPVVNALDPSYSRSLLHRLRRANLLLKGADNIQPRATNLGLSYKLNVRTIFCSLPLADWTFSVSGNLWLRNGCEKYLLKRAVEDILPANVVWREKRGMGVPLTQWLTGPLRRWCQKQLHPRLLSKEGVWQPDLTNRIFAGELSGHVQGRRIGETLWLLLMWRAWSERLLTIRSQRFEKSAIRRWQFAGLTTKLKRT